MELNNVVQNVDISTIIPPKEQLIIDNEVQKLIDSIRENGILEPLLLRPKNNKYEIVIGNRRYEIARILGLKTVPALIKEIDDEVVQQYKIINNFDKKNKTAKNSHNNQKKQSGKFINIPDNSTDQNQEINNNNQNKEISHTKVNNKELLNNSRISNFNNSQTENTYERINRATKKSDIINLSDLNKEYEREDLEMNNNQMNNIANNNMGMNPQNNNSAPQEPTFGGRFFPSLEDEPTNMNMGGINIPNQNNNNLIDLTDMGNENIPPTPAPTPNIINNQSIGNNSQFNIGQQQEQLNPIPNPTSVDNILNIDNLQNNNQLVEPQPMKSIEVESQNIPPIYNQISQPEPQNIAQPILNQGISPIQEQTPIIQQPQNINYPQNQYDMSQNVLPTSSSINQEIPQPQQSLEQGMVQNVPPKNEFLGQSPSIEPINNPTPISIQEEPKENPSMNIPMEHPSKDITPVLNTLKTLALNLESFGYKLNINEENLENSVKLIIEIEK